MAAQLPPSSFPFIQGVRWFNVAVLTVTPSIAVWGLLHVPFQARTLLFAAAYYIYSMLGTSQVLSKFSAAKHLPRYYRWSVRA